MGNESQRMPLKAQMLNMICENCGETLNRMLIFALMAEFGAKLSWDVTKCPDGEEHKLVKRITTAGRAAVEGEDGR